MTDKNKRPRFQGLKRIKRFTVSSKEFIILSIQLKFRTDPNQVFHFSLNNYGGLTALILTRLTHVNYSVLI